ncbi:MAG: PEP-CTERM sorting domain-containing protein [Phycisphaerae bacterium]|jgi:hypothetical protein
MKKFVVVVLVLAISGIAGAAGYVPAGATGLWRFQNSTDKLKATFGTDLVNSNPDNAAWMLGPWTMIGVPGNAGLYADGGIVQDRSWDYLSCYHGISGGNGGGTYINEYTIAMDVYTGGASWFSLYQTAWGGNSNDGDLWVTPTGAIGNGDTGYSTLTMDNTKWHRIVLSVDNGSFFRAYVDGVLFLDGTPQAVDGRFSLELDRFNLFADDSWEDSWILTGTVATWGRALTTPEIAQMGGWIGGSATPTELIIPEPATMALLALGGLLIRRKK